MYTDKIDDLIAEADIKLNSMIFNLSLKMQADMIELKYGKDYVDKFLDGVIYQVNSF